MSLIVLVGVSRAERARAAEAIAAEVGLPVRRVAIKTFAGDPHTPPLELVAGIAEQLREAAGCTVVLEDLIDTVEAATQADGDPAGLGCLPLEGIVEMLAARPERSVVVAEHVGAEEADCRAQAAADLIERLVERAEQVCTVVAGRKIHLGAPHGASATEISTLARTTEVVVPKDSEDFANIVMEEGPPPWLRRILKDTLESGIKRYPSEQQAIAAIAGRHGREPDEVVLTNGAVDAFWLIAATFRPHRAVCVHPTFLEPEIALRAFGHPVERVITRREDAFALDPKAIPADSDLVTLGNPNNPTGSLHTAALVTSLASADRLLVVDEAFMEYVPDERETVSHVALPGLIVLRSVSKLLGIPGLRAGYALAPPELAEQLRAKRAKWAVNSLALAALTAWGRRPAAGAEIARRIGSWRRDLVRRLRAIDGVRTTPSATNFVLINVPSGPRVLSALTEMGFATHCAASFPGLTSNDIRITVHPPAANARIEQALAVAVGRAAASKRAA